MDDAQNKTKGKGDGIATRNEAHSTNGHTSKQKDLPTMPSYTRDHYNNRAGSASPTSQHEATLSDHSGQLPSDISKSRNGATVMNGAGGSPLNPDHALLAGRERSDATRDIHVSIVIKRALNVYSQDLAGLHGAVGNHRIPSYWQD